MKKKTIQGELAVEGLKSSSQGSMIEAKYAALSMAGKVSEILNGPSGKVVNSAAPVSFQVWWLTEGEVITTRSGRQVQGAPKQHCTTIDVFLDPGITQGEIFLSLEEALKREGLSLDDFVLIVAKRDNNLFGDSP